MKETVNLFKALADETRLRILSLLLSNDELCVCDIIAALKQPQSTISRHLAYLRRTGWVCDRRCGPWIYYSLDRKTAASHKGLADFLKNHLADVPIAARDREFLKSFEKDSNCA
jgi:ArsR family transcriptional regulator